jgi:hypothetical protein
MTSASARQPPGISAGSCLSRPACPRICSRLTSPDLLKAVDDLGRSDLSTPPHRRDACTGRPSMTCSCSIVRA